MKSNEVSKIIYKLFHEFCYSIVLWICFSSVMMLENTMNRILLILIIAVGIIVPVYEYQSIHSVKKYIRTTLILERLIFISTLVYFSYKYGYFNFN